MVSDRRGDDDGIQSGAVEQVLELTLPLDLWKKPSQMFKPLFADVAYHFQATIGQSSKIADEIRAPIATTDNSDANWLLHIIASRTTRIYQPPCNPTPHNASPDCCRAFAPSKTD